MSLCLGPPTRSQAPGPSVDPLIIYRRNACHRYCVTVAALDLATPPCTPGLWSGQYHIYQGVLLTAPAAWQ